MTIVPPSDLARAMHATQASARLRLIHDVRLALGEIYSGAETLDAEELLDQLERRGLRVMPA